VPRSSDSALRAPRDHGGESSRSPVALSFHRPRDTRPSRRRRRRRSPRRLSWSRRSRRRWPPSGPPSSGSHAAVLSASEDAIGDHRVLAPGDVDPGHPAAAAISSRRGLVRTSRASRGRIRFGLSKSPATRRPCDSGLRPSRLSEFRVAGLSSSQIFGISGTRNVELSDLRHCQVLGARAGAPEGEKIWASPRFAGPGSALHLLARRLAAGIAVEPTNRMS